MPRGTHQTFRPFLIYSFATVSLTKDLLLLSPVHCLASGFGELFDGRMPPRQAKALATFDTGYTACSLEFCPNDPTIAVCGTYQLASAEVGLEDTGSPKTKRLGRCLLYAYDGNDGKCSLFAPP
jgi:hypothetical protein